MRLRIAAVSAAMALLGTGCSGDEGAPAGPRFEYPLDEVLRVTHLQAVATHNSYHVETPGNELPDWQYTHAALDVQTEEQGVRSFELDTRRDADTGEFYVVHLPLIDESTNCRLLIDCLRTLRAWSDRRPAHHLLTVMIEPKDAAPGAAQADEYYAAFEATLLDAWPRERLLTPDDVQGDDATLREAVTSRGFPTLGATRGKLMFFVNQTGAWRAGYLRSDGSLRGRLMFVESAPTDDFGAVLIENDPAGDRDAIADGARAGFYIRTRADSASGFDTAQPERARTSGAHALSTDYPVPNPARPGYVFELPGGTPSRCNPLTAPAECTPEAIESPRWMSGD
jgi:hypothetical protein